MKNVFRVKKTFVWITLFGGNLMHTKSALYVLAGQRVRYVYANIDIRRNNKLSRGLRLDYSGVWLGQFI